MGCVYKRGKIWWVAYYQHGKQVQESARTTSQTEAKRLLKEREGKVATGQPILHRADRVTYRGDCARPPRALRDHRGT